MQFNEFAQKLSQVIGAGANTCTFTKTILEAIIIEDGHNILDSKKRVAIKIILMEILKLVVFLRK